MLLRPGLRCARVQQSGSGTKRLYALAATADAAFPRSCSRFLTALRPAPWKRLFKATHLGGFQSDPTLQLSLSIKRSAKADKKAQEIITLKETLELDGKPITIASLTKAANAQGMTTSKGNPWLSTGVSRALKRAADRKLSEE
jgi:hypothetical protein